MNRLKRIVIEQLSQGATPHGLAFTCSVALGLGVFPLMGTTTILCILFGYLFKLNHPLLQCLNYFLYPLQILLIPLFLYTGETILRRPHLSVNVVTMAHEISADWRLFLSRYGWAGAHAVFAWSLTAPFGALACYVLTLPIFKRLKGRFS